MPASRSHSGQSLAEDWRIRLAGFLESVAILVVCISISATVWLLGGAIPHARLVLLLGALAGTLFTVLAIPCRATHRNGMPVSALPLIGLAALCLAQLLPIYSPPISQIWHSARADLLPAYLESVILPHRTARSVMPEETRLYFSQFVALSLISLLLWRLVDSVGRLRCSLAIFTINGSAMSALSLCQTFGATSVIIGNQWKVSPTPPFGCFVNPNNAAGWMLVSLASSLVLTALQFSNAPMHETTDRRSFWVRSQAFFRALLAGLTSSQILSFIATVLILAGSVATLSRGGIVATAFCCLTFLLSRMRKGRWLFFSMGMGVLIAMTLVSLILLDLDTLVMKELSTLKDPVSESTSRLLHWGDTLSVVQDFPVLGTGLGSYRYSTLPYQRHYWGTWFQRADNQYVEMLVEGGFAGIALTFAFGLFALYLTLKTCFGIEKDQAPASTWLASGCLAMLVGIGSAAVLDYGVSLPSTSGLVVAMVAMTERRNRLPGKFPRDSQGSIWLWLVVAVALSVSAFRFVPDIRLAMKTYEASAVTQRFLKEQTFERTPLQHDARRIRDALAGAIALRPDDQEARRILSLINLRTVQETLCEELLGGAQADPQQWSSLLRMVDLPNLAIAASRAALVTKNEVRVNWEKACQQAGVDWFAETVSAYEQSPWIPDLPPLLTAASTVVESRVNLSFARKALLMDPAASRDLYVLGLLLGANGQNDLAKVVWTQSLRCSEQFRPDILQQAATKITAAEAIELFGPSDYASCIECAERMKNSKEYYPRLLASASELWKHNSARLTPEKVILRSRHLCMSEGPLSAATWLGEQLLDWPYEIPLRRKRAELLEKAGRNAEAYDEWLRVQSFIPEDVAAQAALERLIRLPPTSEPVP